MRVNLPRQVTSMCARGICGDIDFPKEWENEAASNHLMANNKWTFDGFISESQLSNLPCLANEDSWRSKIQIQIYDRSLVATTLWHLLPHETTRMFPF